jgi:hypothetical protein
MWVYQDVTPLSVKEHLYTILLNSPNSSSLWDTDFLFSYLSTYYNIYCEVAETILCHSTAQNLDLASRQWKQTEGMRYIKMMIGLGMVAHACNPSYLGGRDRRIIVLGQPWGWGER